MLAWHELADLQWRWPGAGLLLLLPLALGWLARRRRQRLQSYADAALQPWAVQRHAAGVGTRVRRTAEALAWCLLTLAAAGPRLPAPAPTQDGARAPHVIDVMVVLDVSTSMSAADVAPDRLTRARLELQDLLRRLQGERLGLLLYAGQAGVLLPPTDDPALFARALQQVGPQLLDAPGSHVARALTLAREQLLRGDPAHRRAVLLVSDAEEDSLQGAAGAAVAQAVEDLRASHIPLYVLVTASEAGALFETPDGRRALRDGQPVTSRPDLAAYGRLTARSGGDLARVRDGDADWERLYDAGLAQLPGAAVPVATAQAWRELYQAPLLLALLLWLALGLPGRERGPRTSGAAALLLAVWLGAGQPSAARAAEPASAAQAAAQAYRAGNWAQALPLFERQGGYAGHMGAGAAAWRLREPARAARHFRQALLLARTARERDDALYNLGHAHYAQQQWLAAAQAWRAVLLSRPEDARAQANLAHAEAELARRASTPVTSDLRGRRGFTVEGLVGMDGAASAREEPWLLPAQTADAASGAAAEASGARLQGAAANGSVPQAVVGAQQLQSGLLKLERLQDAQRELLRGLLRQDRVPGTTDSPGAPW